MLAAIRPVHTFELLEMIILLLPPRSILSVQRVSRRWFDVIEGSKAIQQLLFYQRNGCVVSPSKLESQYDGFTVAKYDQELDFNRALKSIVKARRWRPNRDVWVSYVLCLRPQIEEDFGTISSYTDLYLTQPPCDCAMLIVSGITESGEKTQLDIRCSVKDLTGLKIGQLIDTAASVIFGDEGLKQYELHLIELWLRMPVSKWTNDVWVAESAERKKGRDEEAGKAEPAGP